MQNQVITPIVGLQLHYAALQKEYTYEKELYREQSERISAVDGNDALLKEYNVIVGSFRQRLNAQSLCERLRADGYPAVLAQNAAGWYRVVACSFDNRPSAVQAREALQARYPQFTDAWFLINK